MVDENRMANQQDKVWGCINLSDSSRGSCLLVESISERIKDECEDTLGPKNKP